jgi:hypothetical protein
LFLVFLVCDFEVGKRHPSLLEDLNKWVVFVLVSNNNGKPKDKHRPAVLKDDGRFERVERRRGRERGVEGKSS